MGGGGARRDLAGGVGGAKLADGLQQILAPGELTVVVNTGDDLEVHALAVSPDVDTVLYTLAGIAEPAQGWGIAGETSAENQALLASLVQVLRTPSLGILHAPIAWRCRVERAQGRHERAVARR